jgi:hypothetical protein
MTLAFLLLCGQATWAQVVGPVVQSMGNGYFVVQVNGCRVQVDDKLSVQRGGHEVGEARVMRCEGSFCSLVLIKGEAQRLDRICMAHRAQALERGPALPSQYVPATGPAAVAPAVPAKPPAPAAPQAATVNKRQDYWNSFNADGRAINFNTGEIITAPTPTP